MKTNLFECLDLHEGSSGRVDRDAGIIRGVKILGWQSANDREYLPEGVDPALYEGRVVNANHVRSGQDRSAYDRLGRVVNVEKRPSGLYGDLEILKSHPLANPVFEAAERMPGIFGLSHTARGRSRAGKKGCVIEAVEEVSSVDLVGDPATVSGLYESRRIKVRKQLKELAESLKRTRPGYSRALLEMAEAGVMDPGATMPEPDMPAEAPAEAIDHGQAIIDACKACLDDESLDVPTKLGKIKDLLKVLDKGAAETTEPSPADEPDGDEASAEESRKLKAKLNLLEARERLRDAAENANYRLSKKLLESVRPDLTEAEARALIGELAGTHNRTSQKPRSATPGVTATGNKGNGSGNTFQESKEKITIPEGDGKTLGQWLTSK